MLTVGRHFGVVCCRRIQCVALTCVSNHGRVCPRVCVESVFESTYGGTGVPMCDVWVWMWVGFECRVRGWGRGYECVKQVRSKFSEGRGRSIVLELTFKVYPNMEVRTTPETSLCLVLSLRPERRTPKTLTVVQCIVTLTGG